MTTFTITNTPLAERIKGYFWRMNYRAQRNADRRVAMARRTRKSISL